MAPVTRTAQAPIPDQTVIDTLDRAQKNQDEAKDSAAEIMRTLGMLMPGATSRGPEAGGILGQASAVADAAGELASWLQSIRGMLGQRVVVKGA